MYYLADFSKLNQTDQQPKKESELKKWGRAGALIATGGLVVPVGGAIGGAIGGTVGGFKGSVSKKKVDDRLEKLKEKIKNRYAYSDGTKPEKFWEVRDVLNKPQNKALNKYNKIYDKLDKKVNKNIMKGATVGALAGGALAGAGTYGAYRAGKSIYNRVLKRGKNNDKK